MELISRNAAIAAGATRYFTGVPCKRGHVSERYVSQFTCVACKRLNDSKRDLEARREKDRAYADANRDKRNAAYREHYKKNRAKKIEQVTSYCRERRKTDPVYALRKNVQRLIALSFSCKGLKKSTKTEAILGCDPAYFAAHIERQFLPGMTWENRALWHIDHIVALATAATEADVIALNHFTNLRPLWIPDNLKKRAHVTHLL